MNQKKPEPIPPEALSGVYVEMGGDEDLTVVPNQIPPQHLPPLPRIIGDRGIVKDPCVNVQLDSD